MKVLVFGAGAVGSVLGGFLARHGHEVSLLGRPWHLDAIAKNGLSITGLWGDYRIKAFDLYRDAAQAADGSPYDLILFCVKSYDTAEAAKLLASLVSDQTTVLSLQNGLGNVEAIRAAIPEKQYLIGRVIFGAETEPGRVKVTVNADDIVIGPVPGVEPILAPERLAYELGKCKIPVRAVKDIFPVIWSKVIYNCALNGICTVREMPYGRILEAPETRSQMEAVVRECYAVGMALGVQLEPKDSQAYLDLLVRTLIPKTKDHFPSMLQDLRRGKPTEIDALNGAISRLGTEKGVPTPANDAVTQAVKAQSSLKTLK